MAIDNAEVIDATAYEGKKLYFNFMTIWNLMMR